MSFAEASRHPVAGGWLSRWTYYLSSIPTLLGRIREWPRVLAVFLGVPVRKPIEIQLADGCRFRVRSRMDIWIIKETCLDRDYERGAVRVEDGWTVFDVGAGIGDFAVCIARECPRSQVHAFEPLPDSFALLGQNLRLNSLENVHAHSEAIAGQPGVLYLYSPTATFGQHRTTTRPEDAGSAAVPVPAITLEQAFERTGVSRCDFLKIDCEGAEYEILFAATAETLAKIRHLALETHSGVGRHGPEDLAAFLETHGFRVRTRPNPAHRHLGFLFATNSAFP